jgi:hypothetical protein
MSENCLLYLVYYLGLKGRTTVHGFRSTFSTVLNENGFHPDAIELQLSHLEGDGVRAAYNAAERLPERRRMMCWWADFLDKARGSPPASADPSKPELSHPAFAEGFEQRGKAGIPTGLPRQTSEHAAEGV